MKQIYHANTLAGTQAMIANACYILFDATLVLFEEGLIEY